MLALAYLTHLLAQSSIYWLGAFSSGGYARFFVSTAPLAGILALHGLDALLRPEFRRAWAALLFIVLIALVGVELEPPPRDEVWLLVYRTTRPLVRGVCLVVITATAAGLAASRSGRVRKWARGVLAFSALGSMIGPWAYLVRPHAMTEEASDIGAAVAWLRSRRLDSGQIITTHVWTSYFLDSERNITALPGEDPLADAGPGDVLIWDARYSPSERFRLTQKRIEADKRWRRLWSGPERDLSRRGLNRETPRAPFALIYRLESP